MSVVGKTVARVEERPTSPDGYVRDDTVLIHFTDGTALEIRGSSYEEVSQDWAELSRDEIRVRERAAQGRREEARLARLEREEYAALPESEKDARRAARRAKMSPFMLAFEDVMRDSMLDVLRDVNRVSFDVPTYLKKPRARRS